MDGKMLARLGAVVFVGVAITATAIEMSRKPDEGEVRVLRPDLTVPPAPARAMLRRCRDIGEAAAGDPACLKAWADNRNRFLQQGRDTSPSAPGVPGEPMTLFPASPEPADASVATESAPADRPTDRGAR